MDKWTDGWVGGWKIGQMQGGTDGQMVKGDWTNGRMNVWMGGWVDPRRDGQTDGCMVDGWMGNRCMIDVMWMDGGRDGWWVCGRIPLFCIWYNPEYTWKTFGLFPFQNKPTPSSDLKINHTLFSICIGM